MSRPAPKRATLHAKYFTKRASPSSPPLALLANGPSRTPPPVCGLPHPPCLCAATVIAAIAFAPPDVRRRHVASRYDRLVVAIKTHLAVAAPTLNVSVDTGLDSRK